MEVTDRKMSRRQAPTRMGLVLALLILVSHVPGIDTGLFLDDHLHFAHLRHLDWSYRSAVAGRSRALASTSPRKSQVITRGRRPDP